MYVLYKWTICPSASSEIRFGMLSKPSIGTWLCRKVMHPAILPTSFLLRQSLRRPRSLCSSCILYSLLTNLYGSLEKVIRPCRSFVLKKHSSAFR